MSYNRHNGCQIDDDPTVGLVDDHCRPGRYRKE